MDLHKIDRFRALTYGLPLFVMISSVVIALSPLIAKHPELAIGITYDLTILAPLLYLFLSLKSKSYKLAVVPFFVGGLLIASYILPENGQSHLDFVKTYALPSVELTVLAILIVKIRKTIKIFKSHSEASADFLVVSKSSAKELFGKSKFASLFSSEIAMIYYALFSWKKSKSVPNEFTNYKENASLALAGALLMVVCIETFAFHILLAKWSDIAAWLLTATSIYTAFMIIAHIKALILRPSILDNEKLVLKNGLIADVKIDLNAIERIEFRSKELQSDTLKISNLGLSKESSNHNIALYFKTPQTIEKMYGFTEECDILLIHMDARNTFVEQVNTALEKMG